MHHIYISDEVNKVSNVESDLNLTNTENLVQVHCDNRAKAIQSTENRSTSGVSELTIYHFIKLKEKQK